MTALQRIQADIESLSPEEFANLRVWLDKQLTEEQWQAWDRQIEEDSEGGGLDFLKERAKAAKKSGYSREL